MNSRLQDNGIKALVYLLVFALLTFKSLFKPHANDAAMDKQKQNVTIPVRSR